MPITTKGTTPIEIPDALTAAEALGLLKKLSIENDPDASGLLAIVQAVLNADKQQESD